MLHLSDRDSRLSLRQRSRPFAAVSATAVDTTECIPSLHIRAAAGAGYVESNADCLAQVCANIGSDSYVKDESATTTVYLSLARADCSRGLKSRAKRTFDAAI